jgi:hypothetical protein
MTLKWTVPIAFCLAVASFTPITANATETHTVEMGSTIEVRREAGMVWIDMYVPDLATAKVHVNLRAPRPSGRRFFWQRCDFAYSGAGRYSCGFRTGPRQDASKSPGIWAANAFVDGARVDQELFRV